MEYKDYYQIMGVPRNATQDELKRAYRKLARKYHPDVSKEADAERRFKEVGEAYEVLKDPQKRAAYDQLGSNWRAGQEFKPPPDWGFDFDLGGFGSAGGGFSDFFESLFGGRGAANSQQRRGGFSGKGRDHHAKLQIDLEDAYHGTTRTVYLQLPELDAQGRASTKTRTLNVKVPKGISAGQRIRLAGQGAPGLGSGPSGDLYLEVEFLPHRQFRAEGHDIYLTLPITPWEAALGATVSVPTLGGAVDMKIPAGSQSGQKLRLKGRGLPPHGDHYVLLQLVTPPADNEAAREFYREMARRLPFNPRAG